jgi:hypothetical protein
MMMKRSLFLLIAICYLPIALFAQTSQTGSDYVARRVQIQLLDAPQKVQNASVFVSGNPGPATYYYWIVTNGLIGASSPAGPFQIVNAPNTLSVSNFNQISWNNALGAVSFDVLRTSNPSPPSGACNCAVATAVAGSSTSDQANALNAYTVNTFDPSTVLWAITNESVSAGVSQITFRAGGFAKFSLASNGGAVTLATPLTCAAHQFFTALSGGGVFTCTQPASADLSDVANLVTLTATQTLTNKTIGAGGLAGLTTSKQIFTAGGTFTIPAGVTALKVTVVAGGGAGGGATASGNGSGGGSGGIGIKWLSGLTPGNTLTVTVGGGGTGVSAASGNAGGASSVASGTQTITTISANGGSIGLLGASALAGSSVPAAAGTGGDINIGGNPGMYASGATVGGPGAASPYGGGGGSGNSGLGGAASGFGGGGGGAGSAGNAAGGAGSGGIVIFEWTN